MTTTIRRVRIPLAAVLAALAFAAALALGGQAAHAVELDEGTAYDSTNSATFADSAASVTITKVLRVPEASVNTNGWTFAFRFAPQGGEGTTVDDTPAIADKTVTALAMTYVNGDSSTQTLDSQHSVNAGRTEQYILLSDFIPATGSTEGTTFTHAGEYVYRVTEVAGDIQGIAYSGAEYLMRVYVVNDDSSASGLKISTVTVDKVIEDDGTTVHDATTGQNSKKVDPDPSTKTDGGTYSGFAFVNVYNATSQLVISKTVSGDSADKTLPFSYSAMFSAPQTVGFTNAVKAYVYTGATQGDEVPYTISDDSNTLTLGSVPEGGTQAVFSLTDGQRVVITGLPVGAAFVVTEAGTAGYRPTAVVTHDGGTGSPAAVASGASLTIDENVTGTPTTVPAGSIVPLNSVSSTGDSAIAFTNTRDNITPTGIIVENLPYILLIGIPVIALVAWFAVRRRRYASGE